MQVVFRTPFFQPIDGEDRETNPGVYGKALARWLTEALAARGVTAHDVIPEDFGWVVMVSRDPCLLWYGCGNVEGSTDTWAIFPVAEPSVLQRLFHRVDVDAEASRLEVHLRALVPTIPQVANVVWR
ncbi:hypothetical protein [Ralstonia pseudosolanacearum]|uniref:hypothetical protein n=1 Tax=Ralstonia pseudosolanacearum TaxID=1310165 RepID=UPI001FFB35FE|nr:hypothetical protein [Ralstonia pseudosolanacearum]